MGRYWSKQDTEEMFASLKIKKLPALILRKGRGNESFGSVRFIFPSARRWHICAGRWTVKFDKECPVVWRASADQAGLFPKCEY